jgi:LacI family transcriptional regulator
MKRRITQQDIAGKLGVDKSTVSLALRNHPSIPAATQARVKAMAEKLGFRPDPALATLARQRWAGHETGSGAALAYFVDRRMENFVTHRRFLRAARARAEERGYHLTEFDIAEYPNIEAAARVLYHRGIRGVLVPQLAHTVGPGILDLPADKFTVVCLDLGWDPVPFHVIGPDTFEETRRVWREVTRRGFKRIGGAVLAHTPHAVDDATRLGASLASQQDWVPAKQRLPLLTTDPRDRAGFLRWMKQYRPDVVIGFIPRLYDWLREEGWRVPEDVSFAALTLVVSEWPQVTGCISQGDNIGSAGVDALIAAMGENEWGVPVQQRKLLLQPIWHAGQSLGPGPAARRGSTG